MTDRSSKTYVSSACFQSGKLFNWKCPALYHSKVFACSIAKLGSPLLTQCAHQRNEGFSSTHHTVSLIFRLWFSKRFLRRIIYVNYCNIKVLSSVPGWGLSFTLAFRGWGLLSCCPVLPWALKVLSAKLVSVWKGAVGVRLLSQRSSSSRALCKPSLPADAGKQPSRS